jgi:hypothetical protein
MDASKTKTADTTVRASFALFQGAVLAMSYPLFYFMFPAAVAAAPFLFLFVVFPILAFFNSVFINWFLQYLYCGSVSVPGIFKAAVVSPIATVILGGLAYMLPFLRSPVTQLIPELPQDSTEDARFAREIWGYSFYLFWAGVYGQTIGSGMIAVCP